MWQVMISAMFWIPQILTIKPDCRCQHFKSIGQRKGVFKSPGYRSPFSPAIECLLYSFTAQPDEVIHITFTEFHLPNQIQFKCDNYLRIYGQVNDNQLGESDLFEVELCGEMPNLPQREFFSKSNQLYMELHFQPFPSEHTFRFLGEFMFENKTQFVSQGNVIKGTTCDRLIISKRVNLLDRDLHLVHPEQTGQIHSPDYPRNYPKNVQCRYYFIGGNHERVLVDFLDILLPPVYNSTCDKRVRADTILLQEASNIPNLLGFSLLSNKQTAVLRPTRNIREICDSSSKPQVISDGSNLLLTFISNDDEQQSRGFAATFHFVHKHQVKPTLAMRDRGGTSTDKYTTLDTMSSLSPKHPNSLRKEIDWNGGARFGQLRSANFPDRYPMNTEQEFIFKAPAGGEVDIYFSAFRLDPRSVSDCRDHIGDRVEVYVGSNVSEKPWLVLCGTNLPAMSRQIKLKAETTTISFKTDNFTNNVEQGFALDYAIRQDSISNPTDRTGPKKSWSNDDETVYTQQVTSNEAIFKPTKGNLNRPKSRESKNCTVIISSDSGKTNGSIHIAPEMVDGRKLNRSKICCWVLLGKLHERIRVWIRWDNRTYFNTLHMTDLTRSNQQGTAIPHQVTVVPSSTMVKSIRPQFSSYSKLICHSSRYLEILTYRDRSNGWISHPVLNSSAALRKDEQSARFSNADTFQISDHKDFCLDDDILGSVVNTGLMSTRVPRIDIVLKHQVGNIRINEFGHQSTPGTSKIYTVDYHFVTDFAVQSSFGRQQLNDCSFNFYATDGLVGEFSSPNYPGLYPAEIVCDYKLIGRANEVILLQFIEFDIESSSHTCATDGSGDYVELRACSVTDFLNIPRMRYCQTRPKDQQIIIRWNKPCLVIRFFSNPFITRQGFMASYSFQKSDSATIKFSKTFVFNIWLFIISSNFSNYQ